MECLVGQVSSVIFVPAGQSKSSIRRSLHVRRAQQICLLRAQASAGFVSYYVKKASFFLQIVEKKKQKTISSDFAFKVPTTDKDLTSHSSEPETEKKEPCHSAVTFQIGNIDKYSDQKVHKEYTDEKNDQKIDKESFCRLLHPISSPSEIRFFIRMCHLANEAYGIQRIEEKVLLRTYGLRFVTSSLRKRKKASSDAKSLTSPAKNGDGELTVNSQNTSHVYSHSKNLVAFTSDGFGILRNRSKTLKMDTDKSKNDGNVRSDQSAYACPCGWFICDDERNHTRYIVVQGTDSWAAWQANLSFGPIQFEGFQVLVHRGMYETAQRVYQHILPEIQEFLKQHGKRSRFRFTGHSLGGNICVLVNLMLLTRNQVQKSSVLPVVTFGSPCIMVGGDQLLHQLGLPLNFVQSMVMPRDILAKAFSCHYNATVKEILKMLNVKFRYHPFAENQGAVYVPMGQMIVLQPDDTVSPYHDLLPHGCGLYTLGESESSAGQILDDAVRAAQLKFMNCPHPCEMLRKLLMLGMERTIRRHHHGSNYHRALAHVLRQEMWNRRNKKFKQWWRGLLWKILNFFYLNCCIKALELCTPSWWRAQNYEETLKEPVF